MASNMKRVSGTSLAVLWELQEGQRYTVRALAELLGITVDAVRAACKRLVSAGALRMCGKPALVGIVGVPCVANVA